MSLPPRKTPVEPDPASVAAGHEVSDVSIRGLLVFGVVMVVSTVAIMWAMAWMHEWLLNREVSSDPELSPLVSMRKPPPGPGFEETPGVQLHAYREDYKRRMESYGFDEGGAHIPIDEAMKDVLPQLMSKARPAGASTRVENPQQPIGNTNDPNESTLVPGSGPGKSPTVGQGEEIPESETPRAPDADQPGAPEPAAESQATPE